MTIAVSRRRFLGASGAALACGATAGLGSFLLGRPKALAAPAEAVVSMGAIFFVLNGGARTQAIFNGRVGMGTNPFGQLTGIPVELPRDTMEGTGLEDPAINKYLNLVATAQHHNRTGNHDTGRVVACTGYAPEDDKPGILSLVNHAFAFRELPCVNIGNDTPTTNIGSEISAAFAPIKIGSALSVQDIVESFVSTQTSPAEAQRMEKLRYALEDRFHRNTKYPEPEAIPVFQRKAAKIAAQLDDAALDITSNATMGSFLDSGDAVSNADLRGLFGVNGGGGGNDLGAKAMLAVRLRQLGCAGITLSSDQNFDLHSNEDTSLPGRAQNVGRALAGLISSLSRIADPFVDGLTLLDTTVITLMTDFNRGNWSQGTGFNGNAGSDHQSNTDKTSLQCIPILGGGLPGGRVLGEVDGNGSPVSGSPVYGTRQILATVLDLMGVPSGTYFPGTTPLTEELA